MTATATSIITTAFEAIGFTGGEDALLDAAKQATGVERELLGQMYRRVTDMGLAEARLAAALAEANKAARAQLDQAYNGHLTNVDLLVAPARRASEAEATIKRLFAELRDLARLHEATR